MGGLSTANFLVKYEKKVLVLEKHDKPGGLVTSFKRNGTQFDCRIESLHELEQGETIPQFFEFGEHKSKVKSTQKIYVLWQAFKEDFIAQFPNHRDDINCLFNVNKSIFDEMYSDNSAPIPPYDMNIFQLIKFGLHNFVKKSTFMKYGMKI